MTGLVRAKARDLDVVVEQIGRTGNEVVSTGEELFLVSKAGPQVRFAPTFKSSPSVWRIMSAGSTPSVGLM